MSFDQGEHDFESGTNALPLVLLARHRKKHYNIITDPQAMHKRPLKLPAQRGDAHEVANLRALRQRQEALEEQKNADDHKDDADENKDGGDAENEFEPEEIDVPLMSSKSVSRHNSNTFSDRRSREERAAADAFSLALSEGEFGAVMDLCNVCEPLNEEALGAVLVGLLRSVKKKIDFQWRENHQSVNVQILERFWAAQTNVTSMEKAQRKWSSNLKEKVPSGLFPAKVALTAFNQSIVRWINEKLGHIVRTRKRQSTVDQRAAPRMHSHKAYGQQQKQQQQQPMKMDLDQ